MKNLILTIVLSIFVVSCSSDPVQPDPQPAPIISSHGVIFTAQSMSGVTLELTMHDNILKQMLEFEGELTEEYADYDFDTHCLEQVRFDLKINSVNINGETIDITCDTNDNAQLDFVLPADYTSVDIPEAYRCTDRGIRYTSLGDINKANIYNKTDNKFYIQRSCSGSNGAAYMINLFSRSYLADELFDLSISFATKTFKGIVGIVDVHGNILDPPLILK